MGEAMIGRMIREARESAGLTQEELSCDLCDASTLSRIETGSQTPSFGLVQKLLNRLKVPDFYCFTDRDKDNSALVERIVVALQLNDLEKAEEELFILCKITDEDTIKQIQMYKVMMAVWEVLTLSGQGFTLREACIELDIRGRIQSLLSKTIPWLDIGHFKETYKESIPLTRAEVLLLNALAILRYEDGKRADAVSILCAMEKRLSIQEADDAGMSLLRGAVLCNLAYFEQRMGFTDECKLHLTRAFCIAMRAGGLVLLMHIWEVELRCTLQENDIDEYYEVLLFLRALRRRIPARYKIPEANALDDENVPLMIIF